MLKINDLKTSNYKEFIIKLTIIFLFITVLYFLYNIKNILIIFFISVFLNMLFSPFLNKLNKLKIWDWVWMILIFIVILIFSLITLFSIIPIFVNQIILFLNFLDLSSQEIINIYNTKWLNWFNLPIFLENIIKNLDINQIFNYIQSNIWEITSFITNYLKIFLNNWSWIIFSITNTLFNTVLIFIFTFFIWLERKEIKDFFYKIIPLNISNYLKSREDKIINSLHSWLKSQLILWISIFFITLFWLLFIKLFWVNIDHIFTLALIAWMMEFVPYIWPIIALFPAIAIALWISTKAVIVILILYFIIQQLENNILVPFVMWKTLSLSPFLVLVWMMIWRSVLWLLWIIIAVPLVAVLQIFVWDYLKIKK